MKKIFLSALLCAAGQFAYAQAGFRAGTVELGGSINFTHQEEEVQASSYVGSSYTYNYRVNTLSVTPYVGYFVRDNLALGFNPNYTIREVKSSSTSPRGQASYQTASSLRLGPYVRYYRLLTEQFGFTGTLGAGYARDFQSAQTSNSVDLKGSGFYTSLTPGIIFLPIPRLGIGASIGSLGYTRLDAGPDGSSSSSDIISTFDAGFGLDQLTFSGTYFFGR